MKNFLYRTALCAVLSVYFTAATASGGSTRALSLGEAINLSFKQHPQLRSFELRAQTLAGERETAQLKPAVNISAELENIAGSGVYQHADNAEFSLMFSSVIESRDQREARQTLITARQQELQAQERLFAQDLIAEVTYQFIAVVAAQEILLIQQQSYALAQDTINALIKRVDAGRSPSAELLRAKAALAQINIAKNDARKNLQLARFDLSKLWGTPEDTEFIAQGNLRELGNAESRSHILGLLANHPDLTLLAEEARIRAAELRLARATGTTNIEWTAGVRHFRESDESALIFGVNLPLFNGRRASGAIKTAQAEQQLATYNSDSATIHLRTKLLRLHEEHTHAIEKSIALRDQVLPLLKHAMQETRDAFSKGRYSYMEWSSGQQDLLAAELELIGVASYAHQLRAEIQRLGGANLIESAFDNRSSMRDMQGATQ